MVLLGLETVLLGRLDLPSSTARPHCPDEPWRATSALPSPVFLELVLVRLDAAAAQADDEPDEAIEDGVNEEATAVVG